ncbi:MAG: deoxyribonuclease IV [Candidatus Omnitrophica bacterium]|nr:deoxyribonuclease IV [Candidatus Omnitrophota bacterium]
MLLGVHVSAEGKIYESLERAKKLGCNTMQIFSRSPQRWRESRLGAQDIQEFIRRNDKLNIRPVFIHIPYLINLASPDFKLYKASIKAYIEDILEADALGVDFIVTHMGSHKETSEAQGLKRLTKAINIILERTKNCKVGILLENTSGSGSWLGYKFSHQKAVFEGADYNRRLGLCLDTAHAYLAGFDLSTQIGLEELLNEIEDNVGLKYIKLIHFNDAQGALGSHHDRHAHIGKGGIGMEGMKRIINHPALKNVPFILETPKETLKSDQLNLRLVKKLRDK